MENFEKRMARQQRNEEIGEQVVKDIKVRRIWIVSDGLPLSSLFSWTAIKKKLKEFDGWIERQNRVVGSFMCALVCCVCAVAICLALYCLIWGFIWLFSIHKILGGAVLGFGILWIILMMVWEAPEPHSVDDD